MFTKIIENNFIIDELTDQEIIELRQSSNWKILYFAALKEFKSEDLTFSYLLDLTQAVFDKLLSQTDLEFSRGNTLTEFSEEELDELYEKRPLLVGDEYLNTNWIKTLISSILAVFKDEIENYSGTVESYFASFNSKLKVANRLCFHLVEKSKQDETFAFMVTYSNENSKHIRLEKALSEYKEDKQKLLSLLSPLTKLSKESGFIGSLMENGEIFYPIIIGVKDAYQVLKEIELYHSVGITTRIPNFWKHKSSRISVSAIVGDAERPLLGLTSLLDFRPVIKVGDAELTSDEIDEFLRDTEGLRLIKGNWVEVNHEKLETINWVLNSLAQQEISFGDFLFSSLSKEADKYDVTYKMGTWLSQLCKSLANPSLLKDIPLPSNFVATLRPYQRQGYNYLTNMYKLGLGACLADDMGLGKTIQVIALIGSLLEAKAGPVLIVVPTSLVGNWVNEFNKFLPGTDITLFVESSKKANALEINQGVNITTYSLVSKVTAFKTTTFDFLVIDEAQAIKNMTGQNKAVNALKTNHRLALTGTPIENNLGDLYSIFSFLNPGMLGSKKEFASISKQMSEQKSYSKLREAIRPFILRRMKSDKSIVKDLPEKIVVKEYPVLTSYQRELYQKTVDQVSEAIEKVDGIARRGLVLNTIMKLKQICNHPSQYSGVEEYKIEQSGKFELLKELTSKIFACHDRVLIFTQFTEIIPAIKELLESVVKAKGLVLTGSTKASQRNEIVKEFNGEKYVPFLILSLKAGGVGLNLTSANNVIHFDRWWNPAVENQATDRAFRIGQKRDVVVHTFVTSGTIEEKIDELLFHKQSLSDEILSSDTEDVKLSELSNKEFIDLIRLGGLYK